MVMAVPTPQCVGQEFVRQYYTLLNKDPNQLHRFYNKDSIFLHGRGHTGDGSTENPVLGQEDIYSKIKELNFVDCRAKIRQVDSHETVSGGVVVQVSGELSNDGKPMRKFMQTFVLAPGDVPKKYYVHNDIFRYQDDVFPEENSDEAAEGTVESEGEEESGHQLSLNNGVGGYDHPAVEPVVPHETQGAPIYFDEQVTDQRSSLLRQDEYQGEEESQELQEVVIDKQQPEVHLVEPEPAQQDLIVEDTPASLMDVPSSLTEEEVSVEPQEPQIQISQEIAPDAIEDEKPRTWAALASRNAATKPNSRPAVKPAISQPPAPTVTPSVPSPPRNQQPTPSRPSKESRAPFGTRESRLNARNAPDNHQVFIGNLPNGVSNAEVHGVFGSKINVKSLDE